VWVWVASKEAPILYLSSLLALASQAIPAIAPPELINRGTYVAHGTANRSLSTAGHTSYIVNKYVAKEEELQSSDPINSLARKCKVNM
jgi:poly(3-hydroxyalkanoate) synthetase